jgi:hypothetical protein
VFTAPVEKLCPNRLEEVSAVATIAQMLNNKIRMLAGSLAWEAMSFETSL